MRTPGTYISAIGHVGLISWLLLGWGLSADPLEFDTMTVTTVSGEEFEALTNASRAPEPGTAEPDTPIPPQIDETPPPAPIEAPPTPVTPPPTPVEPPVEDTPPPPPPPEPSVAEVDDQAPIVPEPPAPDPGAPDLEPSSDPTPRREDIVAPDPVAPAPPDAQIDDIAQESAEQEQSAEVEIETEPQAETAPPPAAPEIVIEDVAPSGAVETSLRPSARPRRPAPSVEEPAKIEESTDVAAAEPEDVEEPSADAASDTSINDVLAGIVDETTPTPAADAPAVPLGQGLSSSEIGNVQSRIGSKWVVDVGGQSANITVTVAFSLTRDQRVDGDVRLVSASDGSQAAIQAAFEKARVAIFRTGQQSGGFGFPSDRYDVWRNIEATFDPSGVRLR